MNELRVAPSKVPEQGRGWAGTRVLVLLAPRRPGAPEVRKGMTDGEQSDPRGSLRAHIVDEIPDPAAKAEDICERQDRLPLTFRPCF